MRNYPLSPAALQRRNNLRSTAQETKSVLPDILSKIPGFDTTISSSYLLQDLPPLDPNDCPGIKLPPEDLEAGTRGTRIRVYDQDTFDAALDSQPDTTVASTLSPQSNT